MEGLGQLANHTCCDEHWNANLEVAAIEIQEDTNTTPMAILRATGDIEKDTEILTRYWHKGTDAWQNIFECQCCACTNHTMTTKTTQTETVDMITTKDPVPVSDITPREIQGLKLPQHHTTDVVRTALSGPKRTTQSRRWMIWIGMIWNNSLLREPSSG